MRQTTLTRRSGIKLSIPRATGAYREREPRAIRSSIPP
jgi:hypothetical protein